MTPHGPRPTALDCACGASIPQGHRGKLKRTCSDCGKAAMTVYQREWKATARLDPAFREKTRATDRRFYANNTPRVLSEKQDRRRTPLGWAQYANTIIKNRAKKNGIEFDLTVEDFLGVPEHCPVLGIRLERNHRSSPKDNSPSIDRLDPSKGYIRGNIAIISFKANRMKNNGSLADVEKLLSWMRKVGAP